MNRLISLKKLSKSFSNNKKISVLKKINYSFSKGKIYSLMGPSGSGKSTLLNILSIIDKPSTGSLKIGNNEINFSQSIINDKIRSKKIGIIYQQNNLLPDFTALENVYLASLALNDNKKQSIEKAKMMIKIIGLSDREDHYPSQLS
jgi:ABC-type lipoprotein export system ATPase subunit